MITFQKYSFLNSMRNMHKKFCFNRNELLQINQCKTIYAYFKSKQIIKKDISAKLFMLMYF